MRARIKFKSKSLKALTPKKDGVVMSGCFQSVTRPFDGPLQWGRKIWRIDGLNIPGPGCAYSLHGFLDEIIL